ncbi:hypothetical protein E2C01_083366 [Portunus trituberculatus]|uniref:Uncharacterized protein n=1 Tax=Portunus trituberculatus TaxID=210409 RepID=A0A5B7IS92_PORTR|nr:hypothetical protein [Portunus trituberculatus]
MGQRFSSVKVEAHLQVIGQCGGVDRLTLCLPRKKGGQRLLASFNFPSGGGGGVGHHMSDKKIAVPLGRLAKMGGTTPVRLNILAGESLVASHEIPLANLLAGIKANTHGRRSALFFAVDLGHTKDVGSGTGTPGAAVFYNRMLLEPPRDNQEQQTSTPKHHASLVEQPSSLLRRTALFNASPSVEANTEKTSPSQKSGIEKTNLVQEAQEDMTFMSQQVTPRDLTDDEMCSSPQVQVRHRREKPREASCVGGREGEFSESSTFPSKQGKENPQIDKTQGCVCVPCLVDVLLQCAQAASLTMFVYHLSLQWF